MQGTGGSAASSSVTTSATYFNSLLATTSVVSMARLRSTGAFSPLPGCENSFMALTMRDTWPTPSSDCATASGRLRRRNSKSARSVSCASSPTSSTSFSGVAVWRPAHSRSTISNTESRSRAASPRKRTLSPMYCIGVLSDAFELLRLTELGFEPAPLRDLRPEHQVRRIGAFFGLHRRDGEEQHA